MQGRSNSNLFLRAWRSALLLALMAMFTPAARAVCVHTEAQLAQALIDSRSAPQIIQIVQGAYDLEGMTWYDYSGYWFMQPGTAILGGYLPNTNCAGRQIAPGNTVLRETTQPYSAGALIQVVGGLTFEGLTFQLRQGMQLQVVQDYYQVQPNMELLFSKTTITGMQSGYYPIRIYWNQPVDVGGYIRFADVLMYGNATTGPFCTMELDVAEGAPTFDLVNNTIVDNSAPVGGVCIQNHYVDAADGNGVLLAHNNIFHGNNGGPDLLSDSNNLELVYNMIGSYSGPAQTGFTPIGNLAINPQLDANHRPIESPPSPVINSGDSPSSDLPAVDIAGRTRVIGSRVDRGAYESTIVDGFVFTVTNAADSGPGSLRAAVLSANANGSGLIGFNIGSGCGPHVIKLLTPLPAITGGVIINGYTQPGSSLNDLDTGDDAVLCIVLDGSDHAIDNGFLVSSNSPASAQLILDGLAFGGFVDAAVNFSGSGNHSLTGSHIGGSVGGVNLQPSGYGVYVGYDVGHVYIGGDDAADRNIIGNALIDGVRLDVLGVVGAHNNKVINNYIGVGWNAGGFVDRGNTGQGIRVYGNNNTISGNVIGYNGADGLNFHGDVARNNLAQGNFIGVADDGTALANTSMGVRVETDAHDNNIRSNTIAHNLGTGVRVVTGQGNSIRKNSIYQNGSYGIDLGSGGVTANDDDGSQPSSDYANRGQNFPVLTRAIGSPHGGSISGSLTSLSGDYTIDLYSSGNCDGSNYGEGFRWLRSVQITVPAATSGDQATRNFSAGFTLPDPTVIGASSMITATATDSNGNTSEFSACFPYLNDVIFADGFQ